ncbi:hypothetical protein QUB80_29660 [Chlorogloeopsis sp. ULAP01]|nr:hypothetical protein [Chlorogloeopsis sp. ULAP01]MDM9384828.1 hypothetical protein [Chlorogloeopsis sp. ULAP01]
MFRYFTKNLKHGHWVNLRSPNCEHLQSTFHELPHKTELVA